MNISVIIPIHKYDDETSVLLNNSVESVVKQEYVDELPEILVVHPTEISSEISAWKESVIDKYPSVKLKLVPNSGKTNYQAQVNLGVDQITTEYFSVLEFDDEYSTTFFRNGEIYTKAYPEIDIFLTMMVEVNERNESIKLTNETVWAQQFVGENGEMGYLNINSLKQYTDFKTSGAIIKKSEFKNIGGFKTNIELTFAYEFLLRALNNACKIFSIPKIGYKHFATRLGSLFDDYQKNMPINERRFWFETATKEANFINDRPIDMSRLTKIVVEE